MATLSTETVLSVHHWNDTLFSFTCTRDPGLRFINGQFVMIGLEVNGKPLIRAYSVASANWEEHLEFYSIKVQNGPLTSRLQHLQPGDKVVISGKPTGTLVQDNLLPNAKHLFLLSTGTTMRIVRKITTVYDNFSGAPTSHATIAFQIWTFIVTGGRNIIQSNNIYSV